MLVVVGMNFGPSWAGCLVFVPLYTHAPHTLTLRWDMWLALANETLASSMQAEIWKALTCWILSWNISSWKSLAVLKVAWSDYWSVRGHVERGPGRGELVLKVPALSTAPPDECSQISDLSYTTENRKLLAEPSQPTESEIIIKIINHYCFKPQGKDIKIYNVI